MMNNTANPIPTEVETPLLDIDISEHSVVVRPVITNMDGIQASVKLHKFDVHELTGKIQSLSINALNKGVSVLGEKELIDSIVSKHSLIERLNEEYEHNFQSFKTYWEHIKNSSSHLINVDDTNYRDNLNLMLDMHNMLLPNEILGQLHTLEQMVIEHENTLNSQSHALYSISFTPISEPILAISHAVFTTDAITVKSTEGNVTFVDFVKPHLDLNDLRRDIQDVIRLADFNKIENNGHVEALRQLALFDTEIKKISSNVSTLFNSHTAFWKQKIIDGIPRDFISDASILESVKVNNHLCEMTNTRNVSNMFSAAIALQQDITELKTRLMCNADSIDNIQFVAVLSVIY